MTSQHTPGPWVAVERTNAYIEIEAPDQPGYAAKKVAETSLTNHVANARLIAAAPDLLAALQGFIQGAEAMGWNTDKARAAIAKATEGAQ